MEKILITKSGYLKFNEELRTLKNRRPQAAAAIQAAREFGDLSENADYSAAKEKQALDEGRINFLENALPLLEIASFENLASDENPDLKVGFGAFVTVIDLRDGKEITYRIVSEYESAPNMHAISIKTPLARALLGEVAGEIVTLEANGRQFEILRIKYIKED